MPKKARSSTEAKKLLVEYENLNSDLPRSTRRLMGLFAIAPSVPIESLDELIEGGVTQSLTNHRPWMWWNAFRLSNIPHLWDTFVTKRNTGTSMRKCLLWLKEQTTPEEWSLLSQRLGVPVLQDDRNILNPYDYKDDDGPKETIWTKGGTWWKSSNFTSIIVQRKHLKRPRPGVGWCGRLDDEALRALETELSALIDPDRTLAPNAKRRALQYVRRRVPEMLGYDTDHCAGWESVSWFFQTPVPDSNNYWYYYEPNYASGKKKDKRKGRWKAWKW